MKKLIGLFYCCLLFAACSGEDLIQIEGVEEEFYTECVSFGANSFVLESNDELLTVLEATDLLDECGVLVLPEVDFEQRTMVGKLLRTNFCDPLFKYTVWADTGNENYEVHIEAMGDESCEDAHNSYHWLSFGKMPEGYTVEFVTP